VHRFVDQAVSEMSAAESIASASRALDDLYRTHVAEVYRYAYAVLGNHADAEDVTQTTFVNALRALERGERPRKPSNWLITITHNIVRQRFRQQQARPTEVELDRDVAQEPLDSSGPSLDELVRALQRIPESQREALVMRELEGRPYREIAQILDLSTSALETLLFRARRSLADELENAVTCARAELELSKQLDGRLSRKERRRLDDHIAGCPSCVRLQVTQGKQRRAFKGLALLPLPLSLTLFKGTPSASAAIGIPTIGAAGTTAVVAGGGATGGGFTLGGLALGGIGVKVATVVAAVSVASGVGYVGTKEVQAHRSPVKKTPVTTHSPRAAKPRPVSAGGAHRSATATVRSGAASAKGSRRATSPTGSSRGISAGRTKRARSSAPLPRVHTSKPKPPPAAAKRDRASTLRAARPKTKQALPQVKTTHAVKSVNVPSAAAHSKTARATKVMIPAAALPGQAGLASPGSKSVNGKTP
jgi:RNA polymerase sigma factor (sigma-70 family)